MEPILTSIVAALVAGAVAKAKDVGSKALSDAYEGLKAIVIRKLGKRGAVQSIEDEPESEPARATLIEALAKKDLQPEEAELKDLVARLEQAISNARAAAMPGAGEIDIETVRGKVNAMVENLSATGGIKLGPVIAESGERW